jgi:hypothetical protein
MNVWVGEWASEWVGGLLSEWVSVSVNKCMCDWAGVSVRINWSVNNGVLVITYNSRNKVLSLALQLLRIRSAFDQEYIA